MTSKKEILFTSNGIEVSAEKFVSEDVANFLGKTIWGTQETKYQHHDTKEHIGLMQNPNFYDGHSAAQFNELFHNNDFYLLKDDNGNILAGTQVYKVCWSVHEMPGLMGWIIQNVIPYTPLLRKIYNPKKFEFLSFEALFYTEGKEAKVIELFEGLLAEYHLNSALFWLDEECKIYKNLCDKHAMGVLNHFVKDANAIIYSKAIGLSPQQEDAFKNRPIYISTFDLL